MTINKRIYWTITGLTAAFMLLASIPDVLVAPGAVAIFQHLGYPTYLLPFLGIAKSAAVVVLLLPGFARLKEWAFAGLTIDLAGALYSHFSVGDEPKGWMPAAFGLLLVSTAYLAHPRLARSTDSQSSGDAGNPAAAPRRGNGELMQRPGGGPAIPPCATPG